MTDGPPEWAEAAEVDEHTTATVSLPAVGGHRRVSRGSCSGRACSRDTLISVPRLQLSRELAWGKAERSSRAAAAYLFHVQGPPRPLSHLLPVTSFFLERDEEKGNESITMVYCRVLPFSTLNRTEKLRSRTLRSCQVCIKGRKEKEKKER